MQGEKNANLRRDFFTDFPLTTEIIPNPKSLPNMTHLLVTKYLYVLQKKIEDEAVDQNKHLYELLYLDDFKNRR